MKPLTLFTVSVYLLGMGWALAQNKPGAPLGLAQVKPTPVLQSPSHGAGKTFGTHVPVQGSNVHAVNLVLRKQMRQIQKDRKLGILTETQAKAAWEKMKSLRQQELQYFKQNGVKEITADQKSQLTAALNGNAGSI